jgi:hypothetical protein
MIACECSTMLCCHAAHCSETSIEQLVQLDVKYLFQSWVAADVHGLEAHGLDENVFQALAS